ncbi:MAG: uracil-DNA glycosylase family protein [Thiolinea sp.]
MNTFDIHCTACPRLAKFLAGLRQQYPHYHNLPVAPFGDPGARLLIVGLAPGMHGANASGRPFTGDHAGILLYQTLHKFGFADRPQSLHKDDGLTLLDCRITNAVKCLPPQNAGGQRGKQLQSFYPRRAGGPATGCGDHGTGQHCPYAVLKTLGFKLAAYKFAHNALHELPQGYYLLDTYHCSRYNTNTRRLTTEMFEAVFATARDLLAHRADL